MMSVAEKTALLAKCFTVFKKMTQFTQLAIGKNQVFVFKPNKRRQQAEHPTISPVVREYYKLANVMVPSLQSSHKLGFQLTS